MSAIFENLKKLKKYWNWKKIKNNLVYLIKYDLLEERYHIKDETIEDCIYEFEYLNKTLVRLDVLNEDETLSMLEKSPKSFARYGDGEVNIMLGIDTPFQSFDTHLAAKMKCILAQKKDNLYVGLNSSYFQSPTRYSNKNRKFYRLYATPFRRFFNEICDSSNVYLDACCFGGYFRQKDSYDIDHHFQRVRKLFLNKKIAVVCGKGILDKLQFDIFSLASERIYIYAPSKNAYNCYDKIVSDITANVSKDFIIVIILGMTATVLAADLADLGYIAWDFGHAAKEYDAFMRKVEKSDANIDHFFAPD